MRMKTTVSSKGQIVLPAEFRKMDRIEAGRSSTSSGPTVGTIALSGVRLGSSESTDTL